GLTRCAISEAEVESLKKATESMNLTRKLLGPQPRGVESSDVHGFDVAVPPLGHPGGQRKMRAISTALAQSQLQVLANFMPHQLLTCLAMESSEVARERLRRLACAHKSATLMFLSVCGFNTAQEEDPVQAMDTLNMLFAHFDMLTDI
ncbi:hypothetical protein DUNSADRAFT_5128, partial [Dunaliella salina]